MAPEPPSSVPGRTSNSDVFRHLRHHRHARRCAGDRRGGRKAGQPYLTSSICVFEFIDGTLGSGETDVVAVRQQFGGVRALEFDEQIALEAVRIKDQLLDDRERMAGRDLLIAATARSAGDELVVADRNFETGLLTDMMDVTNLRPSN
ncbi:MAG: PIN domain-containing protein [Halanaeroarchaeum sp.]